MYVKFFFISFGVFAVLRSLFVDLWIPFAHDFFYSFFPTKHRYTRFLACEFRWSTSSDVRTHFLLLLSLLWSVVVNKEQIWCLCAIFFSALTAHYYSLLSRFDFFSLLFLFRLFFLFFSVPVLRSFSVFAYQSGKSELFLCSFTSGALINVRWCWWCWYYRWWNISGLFLIFCTSSLVIATVRRFCYAIVVVVGDGGGIQTNQFICSNAVCVMKREIENSTSVVVRCVQVSTWLSFQVFVYLVRTYFSEI